MSALVKSREWPGFGCDLKSESKNVHINNNKIQRSGIKLIGVYNLGRTLDKLPKRNVHTKV